VIGAALLPQYEKDMQPCAQSTAVELQPVRHSTAICNELLLLLMLLLLLLLLQV
jgi:hypothetical protein